MLKFGTNLLQAVGQFNGMFEDTFRFFFLFQNCILLTLLCVHCAGNYIIAVAFMSEISTPVEATLPDYEQPPVSSIDPGLLLFYFSQEEILLRSFLSKFLVFLY